MPDEERKKKQAIKLSPCDVRTENGIIEVNHLKIPYSLVEKPGSNNQFLIYRTSKMESKSLTTHKDPEGKDKAVKLTLSLGFVNPEKGDKAEADKPENKLRAVIAMLEADKAANPADAATYDVVLARKYTQLAELCPDEVEETPDPIVAELTAISQLNPVLADDCRTEIMQTIGAAKRMLAEQVAQASAQGAN